jgi:hypothetical protein
MGEIVSIKRGKDAERELGAAPAVACRNLL